MSEFLDLVHVQLIGLTFVTVPRLRSESAFKKELVGPYSSKKRMMKRKKTTFLFPLKKPLSSIPARWLRVKEFFDPLGRPQLRPVVITIFTQIVRPSVILSFSASVRPKTWKSSNNHCRPGLSTGRVDHCPSLYYEHLSGFLL